MNSTTAPIAVKPGRVPLYAGVSCVTHPEGKPYGDYQFFDVPDEDYFAGNRTGRIAAWQMIDAARIDDNVGFVSSIKAAAEILDTCTPLSIDRGGAAVAFLSMIDDLLVFAASAPGVNELFIRNLRTHAEMMENDLREIRASDAALIAAMTATPATV